MSNKVALSHHKVSRMVSVIDYLDIAAIFALFYHQVSHHFLEAIGRYIFFPIAAIGGIIQSTLAWRQAKLDGYSKGAVSKAVIETTTALAVNLAVIGALALSAIFAVIAPIIFASALGFKSLYQLGSAIYFWEKAFMAKDPIDHEKYKTQAKDNAVASFVNMAVCTAVLLVLVLGKIILAGVGIAAGVLGASYAAYKLHEIRQVQKQEALSKKIGNDNDLSSHANTMHTLEKNQSATKIDSLSADSALRSETTNPVTSSTIFTKKMGNQQNDSGIIEGNHACCIM
ncbi:MAG TPA: hypothetical protein VHA13_05205 [Gammaproteobacteria bacterium]|nr:hypothetical protein [Gammaproteobacteria bacterium]